MRLGAPVFDFDSPESWIARLKEAGYRAAYCPVDSEADTQLIHAYQQAAQKADIVIAEAGAWSNPISPDDNTRKRAIEKCKQQLALADEIGSICCVNISGSCHPEIWDAPHAGNLTEDTFSLIVETVRDIIDAVQPKRTFYTLEAMPYAYPDSVDSYLELIQAIDRPAFGVHLDIVNWINSPEKYFDMSALIQDTFIRLGAYIKSCHVKDILLAPYLPIHFKEVMPGEGNFDYKTFLHCAATHHTDLPVMLEHLEPSQYPVAAHFIQQEAYSLDLTI